jgi:hypothetical protein
MSNSSGQFSRLRNFYDVVTNPGRYRNEDDVDLDEYVSPKEWRDQTKPSWGERIKSRKQTALTFGFIGFIVFLIIAAHSRTYLPELYGNPYIREAIKWLVAIPTTWVLATNWQRRKIAQLDRLDLKIGESAKSYDGVLETDTDGNHLFVPIKGFDWFGMRGRRLTLADLSDDFAEDFAKQGRDPDDPAKIRLEDSMYGVVDKALGNVAVALSSGLKVDGFGRHSDLYAAPPSLADEDSYKELTKKMEQVVKENKHLEEQMQLIEQQRDKLQTQVNDAREEGEDNVLNIIEKTAEAGVYTSSGGRRTWQSGPTTNGQKPEAN